MDIDIISVKIANEKHLYVCVCVKIQYTPFQNKKQGFTIEINTDQGKKCVFKNFKKLCGAFYTSGEGKR